MRRAARPLLALLRSRPKAFQRVPTRKRLVAYAGCAGGALLLATAPEALCDADDAADNSGTDEGEENVFKDGPARFLAYLARVR